MYKDFAAQYNTNMPFKMYLCRLRMYCTIGGRGKKKKKGILIDPVSGNIQERIISCKVLNHLQL